MKAKNLRLKLRFKSTTSKSSIVLAALFCNRKTRLMFDLDVVLQTTPPYRNKGFIVAL